MGSRGRRLCGFLLVGLLLVAAAPARAHPPGERLDPEERKRLRQELRRHALNARMLAEGEPGPVRPVHDGPPVRPLADGAPPGTLPGPGGSDPELAEADRPAIPPGVKRHWHPAQPRHGWRRADAEPGAAPLSADERRQLRLQLLEERRRRLEEPPR
jgi:hypothetical protein